MEVNDKPISRSQIQPKPAQRQKGMAGRIMVVVVICVIIIISIVLMSVIKNDPDDDHENGIDHNGNGDDGNGDNGVDNGGNGNDIIKVITAMEGKKLADETASKWDKSAVLQSVMGFEGDPQSIYLDDYQWVIDHNIDTLDDKTVGDGKCIAWKYEYYPGEGDIYNRLHVIVFGNESVIQWNEKKSGSAHTGNLSQWQVDSNSAADIAKTLELYKNLSSEYSVNKYTFYDLNQDVWDITLNDVSEYIRVKIDEASGEIIYHYP